MRVLSGAGLRKAAGWYGHTAGVYDAVGTAGMLLKRTTVPANFLTAFRVPSERKKQTHGWV